MGEQREGLSDRELLALYFEHFGMREAVRMFGWALLWGSMGIESWAQLERAHPPGLVTRRTWQRAILEFRGFRERVQQRQGEISAAQLAQRVVQAVQSPEGRDIFVGSAVE